MVSVSSFGTITGIKNVKVTIIRHINILKDTKLKLK